jgi:tRNA (guanine37-N1)-methyltransferase
VLTAQGRRFEQSLARELAEAPGLLLVCGRYEGIDERFAEAEVSAELSLGDYVLSGGELAAAVVIDAVTRLLPGVLGDECSHVEDSFTAGLLDCPQYTRPEAADERRVPEVLLGGDHEAIRRWRLKQALGRTWLRRPELLANRVLSDEERQLLTEFTAEWSELNSRG